MNVQYLSIELDKANGEKMRFDALQKGMNICMCLRVKSKSSAGEPGLISDEIKKMLRLTPIHEAGDTVAQLAENLNIWRARREFSLYRNEHSEPVNTRKFQQQIIRGAQEK